MEEEKYLIEDNHGMVIATNMNLQNALIMCKALFETYYLEDDITYSIVRMQKIDVEVEEKKLDEATEIIHRLMDIINHDLKCFDTMAGLDIKQKAMEFLKEQKTNG